MKKKNIFAKKIIVAILIMQMIVMTCLSVMVIMEITKNSKNTAINNLQTIVQERSQIVDNYVQESEVILSAYSKAGEVLNVLKNPENKSAIDAAQKYTESFSKDINNLEGLYTSEWNTHVLAHTNAGVVGITTREGDSLKALQDKLIATDGVIIQESLYHRQAAIRLSPCIGRSMMKVGILQDLLGVEFILRGL